MSSLETAIRIASGAHEGQTDKAGEPYILHPLRVMLSMQSEISRIVAVLHDVAEDAEFGWKDIHDGRFPGDVVEAIDALTRREGEAYSDYIERASANSIARAVKLADLADNLDPKRSKVLTDSQVRRYVRAQRALLFPPPPSGGGG